jgi:hypothetical protein
MSGFLPWKGATGSPVDVWLMGSGRSRRFVEPPAHLTAVSHGIRGEAAAPASYLWAGRLYNHRRPADPK